LFKALMKMLDQLGGRRQMSRRRYQLSLAGVCGIVVACALGSSQLRDSLARAAFMLTWGSLLVAAIGYLLRPRPFWLGFIITGTFCLWLSGLVAKPPPVGRPDVLMFAHSVLVLIVAALGGIAAQIGHSPRGSPPRSEAGTIGTGSLTKEGVRKTWRRIPR
jgi:hypothetical protein